MGTMFMNKKTAEWYFFEMLYKAYQHKNILRFMEKKVDFLKRMGVFLKNRYAKPFKSCRSVTGYSFKCSTAQ